MRSMRRTFRRAVSTGQMALVLAVIAIGVFATVRLMSTATSDQLDVTADGISDPQVLRDYFGNSDGGGDTQPN